MHHQKSLIKIIARRLSCINKKLKFEDLKGYIKDAQKKSLSIEHGGFNFHGCCYHEYSRYL